jgi:hypothetical protein
MNEKDDPKSSGWVKKTLLLIFTPGATDEGAGGGGAGGEVVFPVGGGSMPPDGLPPVRHWRWLSRGRVRLRSRSVVTANGRQLRTIDDAPRHRRFVSRLKVHVLSDERLRAREASARRRGEEPFLLFD